MNTFPAALVAQSMPRSAPPADNDTDNIIQRVFSTPPNFGPISGIVELVLVVAGIVFALMLIGGVLMMLKGGLRFSFTGDSPSSAAASKRSMGTGAGIVITIGAIGVVGTILAAIFAAF